MIECIVYITAAFRKKLLEILKTKWNGFEKRLNLTRARSWLFSQMYFDLNIFFLKCTPL